MCGTSSSSGSYFLRRIFAPPTDSVARVAPWYDVQRLMNVDRSPSPRSTHTWRASFSATSTASEPPDVKWTQSRSPGVIDAIFAASRWAGSEAKMLPTANGSRVACSVIAATTSDRP